MELLWPLFWWSDIRLCWLVLHWTKGANFIAYSVSCVLVLYNQLMVRVYVSRCMGVWVCVFLCGWGVRVRVCKHWVRQWGQKFMMHCDVYLFGKAIIIDQRNFPLFICFYHFSYVCLPTCHPTRVIILSNSHGNFKSFVYILV